MTMESPGAFNQSATYSAEQLRRAVFSPFARTSANNPGILTGGLLSSADLQLTAPASGMSVNVGTGEAIVGGTEGGSQGAYYARNSSTTNLTISAANPSNPRVDTVCLTIADSGYTEPTGVSGNAAVLQVVTGTPTAGASLSNLSGIGALPASSLLLGYVLVPTSATNIVTADISNVAFPVQLQTARRATILQPSPGSNYNTTSSTFAAVDGTNLSATVNCSGAPVRVTFCGSGDQVTASQDAIIANAMDGSLSGSGAAVIGATNTWTPFTVVTVFTPTVGMHTFAPYWAVTGSGAGNGNILRSANFLSVNQLPSLIIEELGQPF